MVKFYEPFDHLEEKIAQNFGRTKKMFADDCLTIQQWMKNQPHLPEVMDINCIKNFLIYNKCSVEITKQKIDLYYTVLPKMLALFENVKPRLSSTRKFMDSTYFLPLPKLTPDLSRVYIFKIRDLNLSLETSPYEMSAHIIFHNEIAHHESLHLNLTYIVDCSDFSPEHFRNFVPGLFQKMVLFYKKTLKIKVNAIYIVNANAIALGVFEVCKVFLGPKIVKKVSLCKDLSQVIPKNVLPLDYGGEEKSLEQINNMLKVKFLEYQDRFDQIHAMKVAEDLRPFKLENDDFLGFYGNFKKLELD
ncbi:alpha-tocopherol transfer protein-like [Tribolium castaneum]|uniref:alpha-tocopherol transfer protein-like n=1 Tax=Tribolium castaneum TaxID=7070 RepID=UPI0030FDFA1F